MDARNECRHDGVWERFGRKNRSPVQLAANELRQQHARRITSAHAALARAADEAGNFWETAPPRTGRRLLFALRALAGEFPGAPDCLSLLPRPPLRGFLVVAAHLHFPEDSFALHLFLECFQRLIDIVFAYDDMNQNSASLRKISGFIAERAAL